MNGANDNRNYSGFDDANDFLPDPQTSGSGQQRGRDTREWTGGRRMKPLAKAVIALILIIGIGFALNETLFRIRHVYVYGSRNIQAADIAERAGLDQSMGYFTVDEARIREAVEQDPYLQFVELRKQFPNTLALVVKERAPYANVQGGGAVYLVDEDAYVLEIFNTAKVSNTLPEVIGMQVSEAKAGQMIVSAKPGKVDEYRQVMEELKLQGVVNDFNQINLTDSEHIYLRYREGGYMADLGTAKELMAKIGTLRAVIAALQADGLKNGYIDVSIPGEAIYSPE